MAIYISCAECKPILHQHLDRVLADPALLFVNFSFGRLQVSRASFALVLEALAAGRVAANVGSSRVRTGAGAQYSIANDEMVFKTDMPDAAMVVHETIHLLQDMVQAPPTVKSAEATAYLGDVVFRIAKANLAGMAMERTYEGLVALGGMRGAAAEVAWTKGMGLTTHHVVVTQEDVTAIEQEVANHPLYSKGAEGTYQWDGIPE
jgi:hypothetical protein